MISKFLLWWSTRVINKKMIKKLMKQIFEIPIISLDVAVYFPRDYTKIEMTFTFKLRNACSDNA